MDATVRSPVGVADIRMSLLGTAGLAFVPGAHGAHAVEAHIWVLALPEAQIRTLEMLATVPYDPNFAHSVLVSVQGLQPFLASIASMDVGSLCLTLWVWESWTIQPVPTEA